MPLTKRLVEPTHVSRERIPAGVRNELEFVTNSTLSNVILQLSNLSKHAEDLFGELYGEALGFSQRAASLQNRIDRLSSKVTLLDSSAEEVALQDINQRKQFRSSNTCDERVVSRDTLPNAMKDVYESCDSPPPLNKLNPYRTDDKDGLKFYTDPDYFFNLWRHEMLQTDRHRTDRAKKPGRARTPSENKGVRAPRQPQSHLEQMRARALAQEGGYLSPAPQAAQQQPKSNYPFANDQYGPVQNVPAAASYDASRYGTIRSQTRPGRLDLPPSYESLDGAPLEETVHMVDYRAPINGMSGVVSPQPTSGEAAARGNARGTPTRPSQPPPAPPSSGSGSISTRSTPSSSRDQFPPPPPDMHGRHSPTPPPHQDFPPPPGMDALPTVSRTGPAPPPPPPPPVGGGAVAVEKRSVPTAESARRTSETTQPGPSIQHSARTPAPVQVSNTMLDSRSDLLAAIRSGINLRKVEKQNQQQSSRMEERISSLHNVAEIIARRKAMQHSDSESSETEADSDWDEHR